MDLEDDPIAESIEVSDGEGAQAHNRGRRVPRASDSPLRHGSSSVDSDEEHLTFTITWFCKLGSRLFISDTEKGVDQRMGQYFHQTLKEKRDRRLQTKLKDRRATLDSCTVTVQTQARVRDVPFTVEEEPGMRRPGREWGLVDSQLEEWTEKFPGKELRLNIVWEYSIDTNSQPEAHDGPQETDNAVNTRPNNRPNGVGGSTTANMLRDLDTEMRMEEEMGMEGEIGAAHVWQTIHSLWRCDGRGGCQSNNVGGICWRNSAHRHFKMLVPDVSEWCEAVTLGIEGVTPNRPPQSLVDRLESRAVKTTARKLPSGEASTSSNINNSIINVYGAGDTDRETRNTRHTTPKSAAVADGQPMSSPCCVGECTGIELTLFEYGIWLQGNVVSDGWKEDYRKAACLCIDQRLYLSLAKKKPLSWWKENGVTEGIAKAFCKFIQAFKKAKEEGWALPESEKPIEQRVKDWYVGTI
jgi:hypothetical protein